MEKNLKFIVGGILVVFLLLAGDWFLGGLFSPIYTPSDLFRGRIILPLIFLVILIGGLKLIADSLIKK